MKHHYRLALLGAAIIMLSGCSALTPATTPAPTPTTTAPTELTPDPIFSPPNVPDQPTATTQANPQAACPPAGVELPWQVDSRWMCAYPESSKVVLPSFTPPADSGETSWYGFTSGDHNVNCSWYESGTITCRAVTMSVALPADPVVDTPDQPSNCRRGLMVDDERAGKACNGGLMILDGFDGNNTVPVLHDGYTVKSSDYPAPSGRNNVATPVACVAEIDGVTCWNTATYHGFKIGEKVAVFW